jgi:hypothetical protein
MFLNLMFHLQDGSYDWCPLGAAVGSRNEELAKFLVTEMKANQNIAKREMETILTLAMLKADFRVVKFLVEELRVNLDTPIYRYAQGFVVYPFHYAIWLDFHR